jgi:hypothetical protein
MDGTDVHPIRGTAGTARGADTDCSNELLDDNGAVNDVGLAMF